MRHHQYKEKKEKYEVRMNMKWREIKKILTWKTLKKCVLWNTTEDSFSYDIVIMMARTETCVPYLATWKSLVMFIWYISMKWPGWCLIGVGLWKLGGKNTDIPSAFSSLDFYFLCKGAKSKLERYIVSSKFLFFSR